MRLQTPARRRRVSWTASTRVAQGSAPRASQRPRVHRLPDEAEGQTSQTVVLRWLRSSDREDPQRLSLRRLLPQAPTKTRLRQQPETRLARASRSCRQRQDSLPGRIGPAYRVRRTRPRLLRGSKPQAHRRRSQRTSPRTSPPPPRDRGWKTPPAAYGPSPGALCRLSEAEAGCPLRLLR